MQIEQGANGEVIIMNVSVYSDRKYVDLFLAVFGITSIDEEKSHYLQRYKCVNLSFSPSNPKEFCTIFRAVFLGSREPTESIISIVRLAYELGLMEAKV